MEEAALCVCNDGCLFEDKHGQTDEQRTDRQPSADGTHTVAVVGAFSAAYVVGFDVNNVVLLQVINGRVEQCFGTQVHII